MQKLRAGLKFVVEAISTTNRYLAYGLSLVMLLFGGIMLFEAFSRHFFDNPTTWAFEFSKMAFGFYMIWGGAYTMLCSEHVSMDLFYDKLPSRTKAIMDSFTYIFFLLFILTLLYLVTSDAINAISFRETSNSTLSQPLYHWRAGLVVGVFLLFLQGTAVFIKNLWFAVFGETL